MSDDPADTRYLGPPTIWNAQVELMDEAECLRLIAGGGVGRIAYSGQYGLTVLPVSYKLLEGSIVVRTPLGSSTDEALRTGIRGADYRVTFEIDQVAHDAEEGWFVVIQGPAHHVDAHDDCLSAWVPGQRSSAWHSREHFVRITPSLITGRRLRQDAERTSLPSGSATRKFGDHGFQPLADYARRPAAPLAWASWRSRP